jgi:outer membrane protein OmpA-like peptidoglycan-associated protein
VGHGSQRPLANNLTQEGRNRNRRVSIVFEGKLKRVGEDKR